MANYGFGKNSTLPGKTKGNGAKMNKEVNKVIYSMKVCKSCKHGKRDCAFKRLVVENNAKYCPLHQNEDERN